MSATRNINVHVYNCQLTNITFYVLINRTNVFEHVCTTLNDQERRTLQVHTCRTVTDEQEMYNLHKNRTNLILFEQVCTTVNDQECRTIQIRIAEQ